MGLVIEFVGNMGKERWCLRREYRQKYVEKKSIYGHYHSCFMHTDTDAHQTTVHQQHNNPRILRSVLNYNLESQANHI